MLDQRFRKRYDQIAIDPILKRQWAKRVHPHFATLLAMLTGISIFFFLWHHMQLAAIFALIATGFLDTLDGALARHHKLQSSWGTVVDIASDRLVEFSIVFGLFAIDPVSRGWPCMLLMGAVLVCITSFLVVGIFSENQSSKGFHYSPGLIERAEAFLFFGAMILFPAHFHWLCYVLAGLIFWTAAVRLLQFRIEDLRCCARSSPQRASKRT